MQDLESAVDTLCEYCRDLTRCGHPEGVCTTQYHPTYGALSDSAFRGCKICVFLRKSLRGTCQRALKEGSVRPKATKALVEEALSESELGPPGEAASRVELWWESIYFASGDEIIVQVKVAVGSSIPRAEFMFQKCSDRPGPRRFTWQSRHPDLDLAADWLHECVRNHPQCRSKDGRVMPTRLLQLGHGELTASSVVRLVEGPKSASLHVSSYEYHYTALSHCWGSYQPLRTTSANFQTHITDGIKFSSLPKTFQDACVVTRKFGLRKLWIDSLCIIQDSKEDWQRECPRMGDIYRNAWCTIAASDARNASVGILGTYTDEDLCSLGDSLRVRYLRYGIGEIKMDEKSLLSTRGWVLQEKILSTRIIAFKARRMQWQCAVCYRSDDLPYPYEADPDVGSLPMPVLPVECDSRPSVNNSKDALYEQWRKIVQEYSSCCLSNAKDKLPALSGIAQNFSTRLNSGYIAGLWRDDMISGLAWHRMPSSWYEESSRNQPAGFKSTRRYRAPSWSWASVDGYVSVERMDKFSKTEISILEVDVESDSFDPFGEVKGGWIITQGKVLYVKIDKFDLLKSFELPFGTLIPDSSQVIDDFRQAGDRTIDLYVLLIINNSYELRYQQFWSGLALQKDSSYAFRRIGFVQGGYESCGASGHDPFPFADKHMTILKMV